MWLIAGALAAYLIVQFVRSFKVVRGWMIRGIKPWACDLCMSLWASILVVWFSTWRYALGEVPWWDVPERLLSTAGLCLLIVVTHQRLVAPTSPPDLPHADEEDAP
ncbi:MAG: hypothetical protein ABIE42_09165 [Candidatus Eisenbacteria bacterium]